MGLHYQYTDWARMQSKHRWYQAYEHIHYPQKHPIFLFRMYQHMYGIDESRYEPIQYQWFDFYTQNGIEMLEVKRDQIYWWDAELKRFLEHYGAKHFALLPIWQSEILNTEGVIDPRNYLQKGLHRYLFRTQSFIHKPFPIGTFFRSIDRILKLIF